MVNKSFLWSIKNKIKIQSDRISEYTVRTQPRESFLSTLETVAIILSAIENDSKVRETLPNVELILKMNCYRFTLIKFSKNTSIN